MVCDAEPDVGASTVASVPLVHAPLSSLNHMLATPEPLTSVGVSVNAWAPVYVCPCTALLVVTGAMVSMRNWFETCVASVLVALSTE